MPPQHPRQLTALMQTSSPGTPGSRSTPASTGTAVMQHTYPAPQPLRTGSSPLPKVGVFIKKEITGICQLVNPCSSEKGRIRSSPRRLRDLSRAADLPASRPAPACSTAEAPLLRLIFFFIFF